MTPIVNAIWVEFGVHTLEGREEVHILKSGHTGCWRGGAGQSWIRGWAR